MFAWAKAKSPQITNRVQNPVDEYPGSFMSNMFTRQTTGDILKNRLNSFDYNLIQSVYKD